MGNASIAVSRQPRYRSPRYLPSRDIEYKVKVRGSRLDSRCVDPYPTSTHSSLEHHLMRDVTYKVVRRDGVWVYQANEGYSGPFRTRREAPNGSQAGCERAGPGPR